MCPFQIQQDVGIEVTPLKLLSPDAEGNNVEHHGFKCSVSGVNKITITFFQLSTYQSGESRISEGQNIKKTIGIEPKVDLGYSSYSCTDFF